MKRNVHTPVIRELQFGDYCALVAHETANTFVDLFGSPDSQLARQTEIMRQAQPRLAASHTDIAVRCSGVQLKTMDKFG